MLTYKQLVFIQENIRATESAPADTDAIVSAEQSARLDRIIRSDFQAILSGKESVRDLRQRLVIREWLSKVLSLQHDPTTAAIEILQKYMQTTYSKAAARKMVRCWLALPWTQRQIEEYHACMMKSTVRTREQVLSKLWEIAQADPEHTAQIKPSDIIKANELIGTEEFGMFKKNTTALNVNAENVNIAQMFRSISDGSRKEVEIQQEALPESIDEQIV